MLAIQKDIRKKKDPKSAKILQGFFKTGPGEYGEGDIFLGLSVPESRAIAKKYFELSLSDIQILLNSKIHEDRLVGLLILVQKVSKEKDDKKIERIAKFYIKNAKRVNNWDLVDLSTIQILGPYFQNRNRAPLYKLARSKNLWERRISIITTFYFIRNGESQETLKMVKLHLKDEHDLIHKAAGWMLREVGKRVDQKALLIFLDKHATIMPRTMLRYAIEHLPASKRKYYLKLK
ncbi:DNA alkylation repair enzyme [compost metagenome]